jgi:hypothetical protein
MRKKVDLMPDPTTRIGIGNNQEILKIPIVMDIQAPAGSKTSAPATNHPPKCHLDASAGATSVRCTSGPYPMCDVAGSLVSRELVSGVATLLGDCPAIGVTRGTLATGIGKTYSPLGSYFADVTHSENTTQNAAYATIEFSHLSLTPSKKVTGRRKRAVGSPQRDAKAMKLEDRKPRALVNSESSSQPTRQSLRLSSALQDEYDVSIHTLSQFSVS